MRNSCEMRNNCDEKHNILRQQETVTPEGDKKQKAKVYYPGITMIQILSLQSILFLPEMSFAL